MRLKRNYYEVMGLSRNATGLEVKKKYHDLARQFHPDRATDKELAARLFSQINLAYRTLIDENRRSLYDAGLQSEEATASRMGSPLGSRANPPSPYATQPRPAAPWSQPQAAASRLQAQGPVTRPTGAGQMASQPNRPTARPTPTAPLAGQIPPQPVSAATIAQWYDEANRAYLSNDRSTAGALVNKVLKSNSKHPEALRLAGDIFADTGRRKEALSAYQKSLSVQGANLILQEKINRLKAALNADSGGQDLTTKRSGSAGGETKNVEEEKQSFLRRILGAR